MSDRILEKFTSRYAESAPGEETEVTDDLGYFGFMRGVRDRAVSLELRKKDGNISAIGYSWIEKVEFDPSDGITIHALGKRIRIKGRNLNVEVRPNVRLFESIVRHKAVWVREASHPETMTADKAAMLVEIIEG